jgi:hypothetical protein
MRASRALSLTVAVVFLVCHASAFAGTISQGSKEYYGGLSFARFSYSYEDYDLGSQTVLTVSPGIGYFVTDNLELRTAMEFSFIGYDNGGSESMYTFGGNLLFLWHFPSESAVVPFIGAGAGMGFAGDSEDGEYDPLFALPEISAGMKIFVTETACFTVEARYRHEINGLYAEDITGNTFGLMGAISILP